MYFKEKKNIFQRKLKINSGKKRKKVEYTLLLIKLRYYIRKGIHGIDIMCF